MIAALRPDPDFRRAFWLASLGVSCLLAAGALLFAGLDTAHPAPTLLYSSMAVLLCATGLERLAASAVLLLR